MKDEITIKNCPEIMSKEQFCKLCHISKRKAAYLLNSGLVPCENTHKRTRNYKIKKSDAKAYLRDRETDPAKYAFHASDGPHRFVPNKNAEQSAAKALKEYPDVLDTRFVAAFTGYSCKTVIRWIKSGRLRSFRAGGKYRIPKISLIHFLASDYYN